MQKLPDFATDRAWQQLRDKCCGREIKDLTVVALADLTQYWMVWRVCLYLLPHGSQHDNPNVKAAARQTLTSQLHQAEAQQLPELIQQITDRAQQELEAIRHRQA